MRPMKKHRWTAGPIFSVEENLVDPALSPDGISSFTATTKRKRASKPKVRTGCITCKIRRVKCDETKPACTRCTSTGRKCDGYEGAAPPRKKNSHSPASPTALTPPYPYPITSTDPHLAKRHELARHSFAAACRGNSALRVLRPLAADIEGTEQEREFFHRFRRAAEAGLAMHASSLGASFWRRLVPQIGHSDPAVRHALIALGAAYESMQLQQQQGQPDSITSGIVGPSSRSGSPASPLHPQSQSYVVTTPPPEDADQLELFMIQQYNLSIYHLQRHVQPGSSAESVEITLICCLIFVCIETSRGNEGAMLAHVANGLQIIKAQPPDSELVRGSRSSSGGNRNHGYGTAAEGSSPRISRSDWRLLLDFFLALEPNIATYDFGSQPPTPPCPTTSAWDSPMGCYDEIGPSHWEMDVADAEIR